MEALCSFGETVYDEAYEEPDWPELSAGSQPTTWRDGGDDVRTSAPRAGRRGVTSAARRSSASRCRTGANQKPNPDQAPLVPAADLDECNLRRLKLNR